MVFSLRRSRGTINYGKQAWHLPSTVLRLAWQRWLQVVLAHDGYLAEGRLFCLIEEHLAQPCSGDGLLRSGPRGRTKKKGGNDSMSRALRKEDSETHGAEWRVQVCLRQSRACIQLPSHVV